MKAWSTIDNCDTFDTELCMEPVIHAETRGKALAMVACEVGIEFTEATVSRFPAMDDLPVTDWHLLVFQQVGWVHCRHLGCNNKIRVGSCYSGTEDKNISPYVDEYDVNGELVDESFYENNYMPLHVEGVGVFCSDACWREFCQIKGWAVLA